MRLRDTYNMSCLHPVRPVRSTRTLRRMIEAVNATFWIWTLSLIYNPSVHISDPTLCIIDDNTIVEFGC